jgi:hypothetical protein
VILFTGQQAAAQRLESLGVAVRDIARLRHLDTAPTAPAMGEPIHDTTRHDAPRPAKPEPSHRTIRTKRKKVASQPPRNGEAPAAGQSDAA